MLQEEKKYNKVVEILKRSQPVLGSTKEIESEVMRRISGVPHSKVSLSELVDFLFGWVYIEWVRRSLIAVSIILVLVFIYQQSIILKQIDLLSRQPMVTEGESGLTYSDDIERKILLYKISGRKFPSQSITVSEKQMNRLLESVNDLQNKYKDLINIIEADPELKKYIKKKLDEKNVSKTNL